MLYMHILSLAGNRLFKIHPCFLHFPTFPCVSAAQTRDGGGACRYFLFFFCPEDGDLCPGSNEQRYKRESLRKVFYVTGTPPHWITAIDRMVWLNRPIAFFTGALDFPLSYSRPIRSSPGSVSPIIHRELETMIWLVDCRNENQSPLMELIPEFSGDKNTKVKLVIRHGSGPQEDRKTQFLELKHHRTKTTSTSEHEKIHIKHITQVYLKKSE